MEYRVSIVHESSARTHVELCSGARCCQSTHKVASLKRNAASGRHPLPHRVRPKSLIIRPARWITSPRAPRFQSAQFFSLGFTHFRSTAFAPSTSRLLPSHPIRILLLRRQHPARWNVRSRGRFSSLAARKCFSVPHPRISVLASPD